LRKKNVAAIGNEISRLQGLLSTEFEGISNARESEADMEEGDSLSFAQVVSRNDKKKIKLDRKHSRVESPPTPSGPHEAASQPPRAPQNTMRRPMIIRQAKNSGLKASKILLVAKSVYRLGNIDAGYTVDDVTNHVELMVVREISCFNRTSANAVFDDNKSFRICIIDADKEKFLSGENWSVGISIQNWIFKPKDVSNQDVMTGVVASRSGDGQLTHRVSTDSHQPALYFFNLSYSVRRSFRRWDVGRCHVTMSIHINTDTELTILSYNCHG